MKKHHCKLLEKRFKLAIKFAGAMKTMEYWQHTPSARFAK
jgi:hypothetical protein